MTIFTVTTTSTLSILLFIFTLSPTLARAGLLRNIDLVVKAVPTIDTELGAQKVERGSLTNTYTSNDSVDDTLTNTWLEDTVDEDTYAVCPLRAPLQGLQGGKLTKGPKKGTSSKKKTLSGGCPLPNFMVGVSLVVAAAAGAYAIIN